MNFGLSSDERSLSYRASPCLKKVLSRHEPQFPTVHSALQSASQRCCGGQLVLWTCSANLMCCSSPSQSFHYRLIIAEFLFQALGFSGDHMGPALPPWCLIVNPWTGRSLFNMHGPRDALLSKRAGLIFLCSGLCPGGPVCLFRESLVASWTCPLGSTVLQVGALGQHAFTLRKQVALPHLIPAIKHSFRFYLCMGLSAQGTANRREAQGGKINIDSCLPNRQQSSIHRSDYEGNWARSCFDHCWVLVSYPLAHSWVEAMDY